MMTAGSPPKKPAAATSGARRSTMKPAISGCAEAMETTAPMPRISPSSRDWIFGDSRVVHSVTKSHASTRIETSARLAKRDCQRGVMLLAVCRSGPNVKRPRSIWRSGTTSTAKPAKTVSESFRSKLLRGWWALRTARCSGRLCHPRCGAGRCLVRRRLCLAPHVRPSTAQHLRLTRPPLPWAPSGPGSRQPDRPRRTKRNGRVLRRARFCHVDEAPCFR